MRIHEIAQYLSESKTKVEKNRNRNSQKLLEEIRIRRDLQKLEEIAGKSSERRKDREINHVGGERKRK